jgi:hypothetical protein
MRGEASGNRGICHAMVKTGLLIGSWSESRYRVHDANGKAVAGGRQNQSVGDRFPDRPAVNCAERLSAAALPKKKARGAVFRRLVAR